MISIKIKTISMVQLPPPKSQKNLFHVTLTIFSKLASHALNKGFLQEKSNQKYMGSTGK